MLRSDYLTGTGVTAKKVITSIQLTWSKRLMVIFCLRWLSLSAPSLAQAVPTSLPCLDSSPTCLATLTELAIENSSEIEAIEQRLALTAQQFDYAEARSWTNYLTLDPLALVQNILGGGDMHRDRLVIATLELQAADLVRRREAVAEALAREVVDLVLSYERLERQLDLLATQLETQQLQQATMEAAYRTGQGSTQTMLTVWQRTEDLSVRLDEHMVTQGQTRAELEHVIGYEGLEASRGCAVGGSCDRNSVIDNGAIQSGTEID
jgi:hypothetical protein